MNNLLRSCLAWIAFVMAVSTPASAHEGHDHGDTPTAAAATAATAAPPRFAAVSDTFELVGVLSGQRLTLYLDRYADNTPVPAARIELEIDGTKWAAQARDGAVYEVMLKAAPKPGVLPVVATVSVGKETDLLAAELDISAATPAAASTTPARAWARGASWAGAGVALLVVLGLLVLAARRLKARAGAGPWGAA